MSIFYGIPQLAAAARFVYQFKYVLYGVMIVLHSKMAPILYKLDGSPAANAVRMLADIIGLELDLKTPDFIKLEHKSPEYTKVYVLLYKEGKQNTKSKLGI